MVIVKPFRDAQNQRVLSLVILMASVFLIFYTPSIIFFSIGTLKFTNNILGIILFLISIFYLLKSFN